MRRATINKDERLSAVLHFYLFLKFKSFKIIGGPLAAVTIAARIVVAISAPILIANRPVVAFMPLRQSPGWRNDPQRFHDDSKDDSRRSEVIQGDPFI